MGQIQKFPIRLRHIHQYSHPHRKHPLSPQLGNHRPRHPLPKIFQLHGVMFQQHRAHQRSHLRIIPVAIYVIPSVQNGNSM